MGMFKSIFKSHSDRELKRNEPIIRQIEALEPEYSKLSSEALKAKTNEFKQRLAKGETLDDILPEAFATVREASFRVLGLKHYRVQLIGGLVLHQGRIAEMKTGEGKTLVATCPVYLNALAGQGVHVVTVNDYLATRDSEWMGKVYRYLGLSVGLIVHGLSKAQRRAAYASDIVYGTNNEFGFDYLRDNMVNYKRNMVQRGLNFAIVDEVDSILIDEARTPLIISGQGEESTDMYQRANTFALGLKAFVIPEQDTKIDQEEMLRQANADADVDYIVDEKAKTAVLTANGTAKAERFFRISNLANEENFEIQHHINNALKAHGTMHRDDQYVVQDGEVIIVDDFTGRLMYGRRYSDGLHQAIEAKEGVKVERESKTLATITFQNYFRMYKKLSGMTGTALTEEDEFRDIYSLDVITIPTNRPIQRQDLADAVYKTEAGKFRAVLEEVKEAHQSGQPILIGTISVDKSERLSRLFSRSGLPHNVLNAKQHAREAEIVAQAGRYGAITIATNMAGRGTDILLGGNSEFMAREQMKREGYDEELIEQATAHNETEDVLILDARQHFAELEKKFKAETDIEHERVVNAGGLYIIGTERHESRRIDNQLRGRAGRQGDPGRSRFYLSLEDDLMRLFGGDGLKRWFDRMKIDEDTEIVSAFLTRQIESAQKKVEGSNFGTRKNVLEYDDVMNQQREVIYTERRKVLEGENLKPSYIEMIRQVAEAIILEHTHGYELQSEVNFASLRNEIAYRFGPLPILEQDFAAQNQDPTKGVFVEEWTEKLQDQAIARYEERESEFPSPETMREAERVILLRAVDAHWMEHIDNMADLRDAIGLRGYGQHDPVVEYKRAGFDMFAQMNDEIRRDAIRLIMLAEFSGGQAPERKEVDYSRTNEKKEMSSSFERSSAPAASSTGGDLRKTMPESRAAAQESIEPVKRDKTKVGRNDPCPCGSGKKYKNCCANREE
ncbi:MAG: preprotein translocase subunit SecA [Eubacteriales bacterium]|nr:preprotein translocase subunit SecA [Eubacteriales bacterium]